MRDAPSVLLAPRTDLTTFAPSAVNKTIKMQRDLIIQLQDTVRIWGEVHPCPTACPTREPLLTPTLFQPIASTQERPRHQRASRRDPFGSGAERSGSQQQVVPELDACTAVAVGVAAQALDAGRPGSRSDDAVPPGSVLAPPLGPRRIVAVKSGLASDARSDPKHA